MRIIAGRFRGLALAGVGKGDEAARLRPTPDRVREALFSILAARGLPSGDTQVLDLFAGTGALGLEALSRGAAGLVLVENGRVGQRLIRGNLERMGVEASLLGADATRLPPCTAAPADLVFLDPPYGRGLGPSALAAAAGGGWIAPGATIVAEDEGETEVPPGFALDEHRRYGSSCLTFMTYGAP